MARRVTLRDVAQAAGVSVTTASLVLNKRKARLSEDTRNHVLEVAKDLKYTPNQSARSLVTHHTNLITLIVPNIENLFFAALASCLEKECHKEGYSLIVANSDDSRATEHMLITQIVSRGVDGLFLIPALESHEHVAELKADVDEVSCPVTLLDRMITGGWCDGVGFDNFHGGTLAAQHLLDLGHTRIGCVAGIGNANGRRKGFLDALAEAGVPVDPAMDVMGDYRFDSGYKAADAMVEHGATAVFCCNDLMAEGLIRRLRELGKRVPEDVAVIGYDNILDRFGLPLDVTTVEQNIETLAKEGWRMLSARIYEHNNDGDARPWLTDPRAELLEPRLVKRDTARSF